MKTFVRSALNLCALTLLAFVLCPLGTAQSANIHSSAAPTPLITQPIDESQLTVLRGNTHPLARPDFDLGTAPAALPMNRMLLVLKRSDAQESALRKLLDDQQDKSSPSYHKWLTPDEFGKQFGPTDTDLQSITGWLQSHGFQVGSTKGRTVLEFSGSASQVQEAFHTSIHNYIVNGEQHWANSSDPQIPAALTSAVAGIKTLHNFLKKPQIRYSKQSVAGNIKPGHKPTFTFSDGTHGLAPSDYAVIYHSSAFNGGVTGNGVSVGVVGRSNIFNFGQDLDNFANIFLCCGRFQIILNGPDPGDLGQGEEAEATLDTTWVGAAAPGAVANLVVSASTNTTDGVDLSEVYLIESNLFPIMTESFSACEASTTSADAASISALAEQAAAQGITFFVSAGDSGPEGCDDPNAETVATGPISVNVLASTAFNVAVGGTVFNESGQNSVYWGTTNSQDFETALSYIPEDVWNDSCTASNCSTNANIAAGGGGQSMFVAQPWWQAGVTGIPSNGFRSLPDVSLTAAAHDPYLLCLEGSCTPNAQGDFFIYFISGTSASTPSFAGIMSMIEEQNGGRQGLANYVLYRLAATANATLSQCNASSTTVLPASSCIFNDVTTGNNAVPGEIDYGLSNADFQASVGYDLATGLGSVNISNLVNQWSTVTFTATTTTLSLQPSVNVTHGSPITLNVTVTPFSGPGTPTGDVALEADLTSIVAGLGYFTLVNGAVSNAAVNYLPGGSYNVFAHYDGDGTYAPSAATASVTVAPEPSTTTTSVLGFDSNGNQFNFVGGAYGSFVYLRADVAGISGFGIPTGYVTFLDNGAPLVAGSSLALNSQGNTATPNGVRNFDTGTHTISASYSGDSSFNPSTSTQPMSFTITPGFFASFSPTTSTLVLTSPGTSGQLQFSVSTSTSFNGTISLACSGLPSEATCTFSPATITAAGSPLVSAPSVTVTTTAPVAMLHEPKHPLWPNFLTAASFAFGFVVLVGNRRRRRFPFVLTLLILLMFVPGCGGGSSNSSSTSTSHSNPGTPTGTYNIVVTATSGSMVSTTGFTLVLQ